MRLTLSLGQMESIVIIMEEAFHEAGRGSDAARDPEVRLRALPHNGVGVTVILPGLPGLPPVVELREVLLDRIGRTVVLPVAPKVQAPGRVETGMRAKAGRL